MKQEPTLVNIAAAGMMMQVALAIIVVLGLISYRFSGVSQKSWDEFPGDSGYHKMKKWGFGSSHLYGATTLMLIVTASVLGLSVDFSSVWKPLTYNLEFTGFPTEKALRSVFIIDILFIALVLFFTGGSRQGPFCALCFMLPTLAIFLKQPFTSILAYVVALIVVFTLNLRASRGAYGKDANLAYWIVSIACVMLTTFIAYVTQVPGSSVSKSSNQAARSDSGVTVTTSAPHLNEPSCSQISTPTEPSGP